MIVLKLGGSVITEKGRRETLDGPALDRAADAIAMVDEPIVLVHGGGSFGHYHADLHGVNTNRGTWDAREAMDIHSAMTTLNQFVLDRLHKRDISALPVHPLSFASRDDTGILDVPTGSIEAMLEEGFVPVLHGDGVIHRENGVTVLSGDELVVELARRLTADRVGMCSTVPGVLNENGEVIEEITTYEAVADVVGESERKDVTGGMAAKIRELVELDMPASVFGLDELPTFLNGGFPGTSIR